MNYDGFYRKYRTKMMDWVESKGGKYHQFANVLMAGPDLFHLLVKLSLDPEVPSNDKVKLIAAIAYFVSPIDFLPEAILGPIGYADDIAVAAYVLNTIINHTDPEIIEKHWAGEGDVLVVVKQVINVADRMIGSGLWNKLKKKFS